MNDIQERLVRAAELPEVLEAAYQAFEEMLAVVRRNDDPASEFFLPMVAAGASAASGRDFVCAAPALPARPPLVLPACGPEQVAGGRAAAAWLMAVSMLLANKLIAFGAEAQRADRRACIEAAGCALQVHGAMRGGAP